MPSSARQRPVIPDRLPTTAKALIQPALTPRQVRGGLKLMVLSVGWRQKPGGQFLKSDFAKPKYPAGIKAKQCQEMALCRDKAEWRGILSVYCSAMIPGASIPRGRHIW
jgi:hypothetical protein